MQRRTLFRLGLGASVVLGLAGLGAAAWSPGWREGRLSPSAQAVLRAVATAVLEGVLPQDARIRELALQGFTLRMTQTVAGLAPAVRAELSDLLALLSTAPGRYALTGLAVDWPQATPQQLAAALQGMRTAGSQTRQQVYHALRDLTNAAWFADAGTWNFLGYPGPQAI
jgi:hypothetical protein